MYQQFHQYSSVSSCMFRQQGTQTDVHHELLWRRNENESGSILYKPHCPQALVESSPFHGYQPGCRGRLHACCRRRWRHTGDEATSQRQQSSLAGRRADDVYRHNITSSLTSLPDPPVAQARPRPRRLTAIKPSSIAAAIYISQAGRSSCHSTNDDALRN